MSLLDDFVEAAEANGALVHRLAGWDAVTGLVVKLAEGGRIAVSPALATERAEFFEALGDGAVVADDAASVADVPVGVMACPMAVAETGSVLVVEPDLTDRSVSMLVGTLVQVVPAEAVVASLDDVAAWLSHHAADGYAALVTGPSRTADIERSLTVGVQGPHETHVVLLGGPN